MFKVVGKSAAKDITWVRWVWSASPELLEWNKIGPHLVMNSKSAILRRLSGLGFLPTTSINCNLCAHYSSHGLDVFSIIGVCSQVVNSSQAQATFTRALATSIHTSLGLLSADAATKRSMGKKICGCRGGSTLQILPRHFLRLNYFQSTTHKKKRKEKPIWVQIQDIQ